MLSDTQTFFLSFAAVFAGIALYIWRLERATAGLAARVASLESRTAKPKGPDAPGSSQR